MKTLDVYIKIYITYKNKPRTLTRVGRIFSHSGPVPHCLDTASALGKNPLGEKMATPVALTRIKRITPVVSLFCLPFHWIDRTGFD